MLGKAWEWIQEKPLRVSGFLCMNNVPLIWRRGSSGTPNLAKEKLHIRHS